MSLAAFFAQTAALLRGEVDVTDAEAELGTSPSGSASYDFYRKLQERHLLTRMGQLFPQVKAVVVRDGEAAWEQLVTAFVAAHPPSGWSTHAMGAPCADWLAELTRPDALPLAGLADWARTRWVATHATDDGDGVGTRIAARQYALDIPAWAQALRSDPQAPQPPASPVQVVVYREVGGTTLRTLTPTAFTLAVLARRAGMDLPEAFAHHAEALASEEDRLVQLRALSDARRASPETTATAPR